MTSTFCLGPLVGININRFNFPWPDKKTSPICPLSIINTNISCSGKQRGEVIGIVYDTIFFSQMPELISAYFKKQLNEKTFFCILYYCVFMKKGII